MTSLSIVPFLTRTVALAALLVATTGCYDKAEFYDPATGDEVDPQVADETDADEQAQGDEQADEQTEEQADEQAAPGDETDEVVEPAQCAFGEDVADLASSDQIDLGDFEHLFRPQDLTVMELAQLAEGLDRFGWAEATGTDGLFAEIDDSRLLVRDLELLTTGQSFTHLRFHVDGVEFGFLFATDSFRVAAAVDGGDIVACTVPLT